jgi:hypothetical protein
VIVCDIGPLRLPIATRNTIENARVCSPAIIWRRAGPKIEAAALLRSIVQRTLSIVDLQIEGYEQMAELVEANDQSYQAQTARVPGAGS